MEEFTIGQRVRIKRESSSTNRRVPEYAKGRVGTVVKSYGVIPGCQHDHVEDWGPLYLVLLDSSASSREEKVYLDVHWPWLESQAPT